MTSIARRNALEQAITPETTLEDALRLFVEHFDTTTVPNCAQEHGDMLLFQWGGPYSWNPHFNINITRQFTYEYGGEYGGMEQLYIDINYPGDNIQIEDGNMWFDGNDLDAFLNTILQSEPVQLMKNQPITAIEVTLTGV